MIRKKLSSQTGFTLTELLVTVVIMALLGIAVGVGISAAARAHGKVVMGSEAAVLSSTLAVELADELRFARDISSDGGVLTFTCRFGKNVSVDGVDGVVTVGGTPILSPGAYMGLEASAEVEYSGGSFTVTIIVYNPSGGELMSSSFKVAPISG